jgi:outer membrane lipoprotein-sorting protein
MSCNYLTENISDLFDDNITKDRKDEILSHVSTCTDCAGELAKVNRVIAQIKPGVQIRASETLKDRVIQTIIQSETQTNKNKGRILTMMNPTWKKITAIAAVLIIVFAMIPLISHFNGSNGDARAANSLIDKSIKAMAGVSSVYMNFDVRTAPGDNFEYIDIHSGFVNHKLWRVMGDPGKWKIEKPGRIVVMDGEKQYMYIAGPQTAIVGSTDASFVEWMKIFLDPQKLLEKEKGFAAKYKAGYETVEKDSTLILTVKAKAIGDFKNDYLLNSSVPESDNRRVYTFDKATKRLISFEVFIETGTTEVQIIKVNEIRYDQNIPPSTFAITLPDNVKWVDARELMGGKTGITATTPEQVARMFFEACSKEDWQAFDQLMPGLMQSGNAKEIREMVGGLTVISIGKAFKSGQYPGDFVPYEIKFKSGDTKKQNLAVRNDNPQKRWTVDGGF